MVLQMKMLEDRLISIQRRQAMQVTIFDILFMLLNWTILGMYAVDLMIL
jgi:hypothetical protein